MPTPRPLSLLVTHALCRSSAACATMPPPAPPPPPMQGEGVDDAGGEGTVAWRGSDADRGVQTGEQTRAWLAQRRRGQIARLRGYAEAGVFPHNNESIHPMHMFIDPGGRLCAVANLIARDGQRPLVAATARRSNGTVVAAERSGPLHDWVLTSGLTREEVDRIQAPAPYLGGGAGRPVVGPPDETFVLSDRAISERAMIRQLQAHFAEVIAELEDDTDASLTIAALRLESGGLPQLPERIGASAPRRRRGGGELAPPRDGALTLGRAEVQM
jgi:hypothetical protein